MDLANCFGSLQSSCSLNSRRLSGWRGNNTQSRGLSMRRRLPLERACGFVHVCPDPRPFQWSFLGFTTKYLPLPTLQRLAQRFGCCILCHRVNFLFSSHPSDLDTRGIMSWLFLICSGWMNVTLEICRVKKALGISEQMKIHLTELSTGLFQCWRLDSDAGLSDNGLFKMNTLSSFSGWKLLFGHHNPIFQTPIHGHVMSWPSHLKVSAPATAPTALSMTDSRRSGTSFFASVSWRSPLCHCIGWVNEIGPGLLFFFCIHRNIIMSGRHPANDTHYRNVPTPKCWLTGRTWRLGADGDHREKLKCSDISKKLQVFDTLRSSTGYVDPPQLWKRRPATSQGLWCGTAVANCGHLTVKKWSFLPQNIKTWGQNYGPPKSDKSDSIVIVIVMMTVRTRNNGTSFHFLTSYVWAFANRWGAQEQFAWKRVIGERGAWA